MFFRNYSKPGKGISKEEIESKSGILLYFDILFRRIWQMMTLNLLYLLVSIPAILISIAISVYFLTLTASIRGVDVAKNSTSILILGVLFAIVFFQITGSGPASVAKSYVLRNYVNDRHSWGASEFFENIKKNFIQGIAVYIINTVLLSVLLFAWITYSYVLKSTILQIVVLSIIVIYTMMQLYVYQIVASVVLKVKHIYKNALALTMIKLPWNLLVMVGTIIIMYLMFCLASILFIACVALIIVIYFTIIRFTQIFMTNNIMNMYIINPGLQEENQEI